MRSNYLKISIITVSYNQAEFIDYNIQSVVNQNYPNFEHIIIDGGSTDNTINILKKYPHLIWLSENDRGQAHALNKALSRVSGDLVFWINSDDEVAQNAFYIVNDYFKCYPDSNILTGICYIIDEFGVVRRELTPEPMDYKSLVHTKQNVIQPSTVFRRKVFEEVGPIDEELHYVMDHDFFIRASKKFSFHLIDKPLARFRTYNTNKTAIGQHKFAIETIQVKLKYGGKLISLSTLNNLFMIIKEPFKRSTILRRIIRKIKGANPDFIHYN